MMAKVFLLVVLYAHLRLIASVGKNIFSNFFFPQRKGRTTPETSESKLENSYDFFTKEWDQVNNVLCIPV